MKEKEIFNWKRIGSYTVEDYRFYLNQIASVAKNREGEEMTIDDKLAIALLFDLDYHARYQSDVVFMQAMAVLDTITKDENDFFGRTKIDLSKIPLSTKQFFIKLYKDEIKGLDGTYKKLIKLIEADESELPVFNGLNLSEIEGEKEDAGGGILVEGYDDFEDEDYESEDGYEDE